MWTIDHLISIFNNDWRVFGNVLKKQRGAFYFEKRHLRPTWRGKLLPVVVRCSFCLTDSSRWRCGAEPVCGKGLKRSGMLPVETQTRCCGRRECLMEMLGKAGGVGGGGGGGVIIEGLENDQPRREKKKDFKEADLTFQAFLSQEQRWGQQVDPLPRVPELTMRRLLERICRHNQKKKRKDLRRHDLYAAQKPVAPRCLCAVQLV